MKDDQLKLLPDWRYCNIQKGSKVPIGYQWNFHPLDLGSVYTDGNIGLILGPASQGVCAIDFDGEEAIDFWTKEFGIMIDELDTIMWTSGKDYRCQAAFTIPKEYWDVLKKKVVNKLEFRWTGGQSVMPPSTLDDGREYVWINSPQTTTVKQLPDVVLTYWLNMIYNDITKYDVVIDNKYETKTYDEEIVNELLQRIQHNVGNLRGDYDVWRTIAWATCSSIGINNARMLMMYYWPEKTRKEMSTLMSWKQRSDSPKIGTLIKLSGISSKDLKKLERDNERSRELETYEAQLAEMNLLREIIRKKKYG